MRRRCVYIMLTACGVLSAVLVSLLVITLSTSQADAATPRDTVLLALANNQGEVLGNYDETTWTGQRFMQFRGIPYAEPPIGSLRFQPPVARKAWFPKILDGSTFGQRCPVITHIDGQLSDAQLEDCLNLCVYTKNLTARQPVMFYIYGGGFYNGSAEDHPPHYLLEQDIVLVVPHYRVGALGWLTTRSKELPGNAPIADILLALDWVQQHIHLFGGNADQVTIVGQSAGACVSSALLLSPYRSDENLFHRAIVQSGSIFAAWATNPNPLAQAQRICVALGCSDTCDSECLQAARVVDILQVTQLERFSPITGDLMGLLPKEANELIKTYKRKVPLLTGFTEHDGSFVLATYYDVLCAQMANISSMSVRQFSQGLINMMNDTTGLTDNLLYRLLYTPELLHSYEHKTALPSYFDLTTITYMKSPVISLATKLYARQTDDTPIYVYSFEYEGNHTRFGYELDNSYYPFNGGVHHSNDNIYIFATHHLEEGSTDVQIARQMIEIWTSFVINGETKHLSSLSSAEGPYNRIDLQVESANDLLQTLTATIDDPNNGRLQRDDVEF
ncbi:glutactin isoform X1 [Drosophila willistoni]|uniref:glutactin isoform X1 n=1 Tax=Drosophila willistoni TaxID=7260 RepID=UPI001F0834CD|nr:glutactin isoform X1 [Drosophila willistoni]